ncbi:unnamed protein product [Oikopleura dioica]|uniref:Uncharacterized protein n=1 Tax=Oikopleura dioica TaxID=34765 RepID=E4XAA4_OIKDI|nr:unnamed protein product [Oikopleura dioica]
MGKFAGNWKRVRSEGGAAFFLAFGAPQEKLTIEKMDCINNSRDNRKQQSFITIPIILKTTNFTKISIYLKKH